MGLGAILFVEIAAKSPEKQVVTSSKVGVGPLTGEVKVIKDLIEVDMEQQIMQEQVSLPELSEVQIRQDVVVITSNH